MNWDKLDLHLENLIPGVVALAVLMIGRPISLGSLTNQGTLVAIAFVGYAHMIGAIANIFARLLLDMVWRKTVSIYFMRAFLGERIGAQYPTHRDIDRRYSDVITDGVSCGNERVVSEIIKRRQPGRILRSALVPSILAVVAVGRNPSWEWRSMWLGVLAAYIALLFLYAYAEVVVFQESYRGERIKNTSDNPLVT